jgi:Heparinase II/III-like protein/Heparinase II/III N-terminus
MTSIRRSLKAAAELGLGPLASYGAYRLGLLTGRLRRQTPDAPWDEWTLERLLEPGVPTTAAAYVAFRADRAHPRFFFDADGPQLHLPSRAARLTADAILGGKVPQVRGEEQSLGAPPRSWNIVQGEAGERGTARAARHWSKYDLGRLGVDARRLWEASRFGWVLPLARSFHATKDRRYAEGFWRRWDSWRSENPPYRGVQWASAQEAALRTLSLVFALHAFAPAWRSRPERIAGLVGAILAHAARIPPTLSYGRAQGNNHLLSEAAALYTVGLLLPEARPAARWRHVGRSLFIEGIAHQVFPDGGYVQHSANYHRLALQLGLWVARLAQLNHDPLPDETSEALGRLTLSLAVLIDRTNGRPARFGPDDSSDLFPMDRAFQGDYRPTLQAASRQFQGSPLYAAGPWDELSGWLGLSQGPRHASPGMAIPNALPDAGLFRLAGRTTWAVLRAAQFRSRPGHSDQLHVDLWWRGENVALDPGSYLYQAPAPWDGGLAEADVHNTLTMDGDDPMERAGPFLWLDWAQAQLLGLWESRDGTIQMAAAEHHGYRGVTHRRTLVRAGESTWIVVDDVIGVGAHRVCLGWNLPDLRWKLRGQTIGLRAREGPVELSVEGGELSVFRAGKCLAGGPAPKASTRWGWWAPVYGRREPGLRVVAVRQASLPLRLVSWWRLGGGRTGAPKVEWNPPGEGEAAIRRLRLAGAVLKVDKV